MSVIHIDFTPLNARIRHAVTWRGAAVCGRIDIHSFYAIYCSLLYQEGVDWILLLLGFDLIDKDINQITEIFHKHQTVRINDLLWWGLEQQQHYWLSYFCSNQTQGRKMGVLWSHALHFCELHHHGIIFSDHSDLLLQCCNIPRWSGKLLIGI